MIVFVDICDFGVDQITYHEQLMQKTRKLKIVTVRYLSQSLQYPSHKNSGFSTQRIVSPSQNTMHMPIQSFGDTHLLQIKRATKRRLYEPVCSMYYALQVKKKKKLFWQFQQHKASPG